MNETFTVRVGRVNGYEKRPPQKIKKNNKKIIKKNLKTKTMRLQVSGEQNFIGDVQPGELLQSCNQTAIIFNTAVDKTNQVCSAHR